MLWSQFLVQMNDSTQNVIETRLTDWLTDYSVDTSGSRLIITVSKTHFPTQLDCCRCSDRIYNFFIVALYPCWLELYITATPFRTTAWSSSTCPVKLSTGKFILISRMKHQLVSESWIILSSEKCTLARQQITGNVAAINHFCFHSKGVFRNLWWLHLVWRLSSVAAGPDTPASEWECPATAPSSSPGQPPTHTHTHTDGNRGFDFTVYIREGWVIAIFSPL